MEKSISFRIKVLPFDFIRTTNLLDEDQNVIPTRYIEIKIKSEQDNLDESKMMVFENSRPTLFKNIIHEVNSRHYVDGGRGWVELTVLKIQGILRILDIKQIIDDLTK